MDGVLRAAFHSRAAAGWRVEAHRNAKDHSPELPVYAGASNGSGSCFNGDRFTTAARSVCGAQAQIMTSAAVRAV